MSFAPELARGDGTDAEYAYAELLHAEARHFWFRSRNRLIVWALRRYFASARTMLEIGCGAGAVLHAVREALPRLALEGSEILGEGLRLAGSRLPGVRLYQMDVRRIPFRGHFDVVGAFDVIEHLEDDEGALSEIGRAIRPGGGVLLTVPQHRFLWSGADDFSHHKRRYGRRELADKMTRAGFEVVRVTSFFSPLLPLLLARRWQERRRGGPFDPRAELRVVPAVNGLLGYVTGLELLAIRAGLSSPAGPSLLAVGRR